MKFAVIGAVLALALGGAAEARGGGGSHYVSGYTKSDGTYVAPHTAANPGSATVAPLYVPSTPSHSVTGHVTNEGVYVQPYRATNANGTRVDNYSTKGNVNPYTGKPGTKSPYGF